MSGVRKSLLTTLQLALSALAGAAGFALIASAPAFAVILPLAVVLALVAWERRTAGSPTDDHVEPEVAPDALVTELVQLVLGTESGARKLGAQVGETLSSTTRIASRSATAQGWADTLSDQVGNGAAAMEEILATVESLVKRIEFQRGLVQQSASAIEEMSASIERVAHVSSARHGDAEALRRTTDRGSHAVQTTERAIEDVSASVEAVHAMIDVINDIAARTNLLAMNAAIEAAHAGSAGRGFAVVAAEIRKLAETTAANASQISSRLTALVDRIGDVRAAGSETQSAFREIEQGVVVVADSFSEITGSTSELSAGAREVVVATESLRDVSDEITGSAEEMRIAARDVNDLIAQTRQTASATREAMDVITEASRSVTLTTNRVSELSIENNDHILSLIERLRAEEGGDGSSESREATSRLHLSRVVLGHLSWIGQARTRIDGMRGGAVAASATASGGSAGESALGRWLALDGKTVVADRESYRALSEANRRCHAILDEILSCRERGTPGETGCADVEEKFEEMLQHSQRIVEILTAHQTGSFVQWSSAYSVDVATFDDHHRRLFALIDRLYQAMRGGVTGADLQSVFDDLVSYTQYHFTAEETAFEHFAYPGCETQKAQHRELVAGIERLQADMAAGKQMVAVEVMEFLRDWLTRHIRGCDRLYAEFFRDKDLAQILQS
jgi:methyl-accepting chemotaxis protein